MRRGSLKGFQGMDTRVVREKDTKTEYFIKGPPDSTFRDALKNSWPFTEHKVSEKWRILTPSGEDVSDKKLSECVDIVIVEFL
jgi:hypothetical protein